jgi:hypothetical protein
VNSADTRNTQGLAVTGIGTVDCARHDMKRPNGVGDLQKGERYVYFPDGCNITGIDRIQIP